MITESQRQARRKFIGSSDACAVLGLDPYRSPADIYLSKVNELDDITSDAIDAGNLLEAAVVAWASRQLGALMPDQMMVRGNCGANLDAIGLHSPFIVEAKATGITGPANKEYDPSVEDDTGLPTNVIVQVHHQFYVAGPEYRIAWVAVLIGGVGFRMFRVDRQDELAAKVGEAGEAFMERHVIPRVPPSDSSPSLEVLKRVRRVPNKPVAVADELVENWQRIRERRLEADKAAKALKTTEEETQAALIASIGDGDAAVYSGGTVTYYETHRKAYSVEAGNYRTLRLPKGSTAPIAESEPAIVKPTAPRIRASILKKFGVST
jgi:predicted phage-related endonuclease